MSYHGLGNFGQTEEIKAQLTDELLSLEESSSSIGPVTTIRRAKSLLENLRKASRWEDSRSDISASFLSLVRDETQYGYLKYTDISARSNALIAASATRLTEEEALRENVSGLQKLNAESAEDHLSTVQRLSRPGGFAWEVVKETPAPLVEEISRRGGQVKDVGVRIIDEVAPVGQQLIDELDSKEITNPLLGVAGVALLVFMKNKILAGMILAGLIYLTKQRQVGFIKSKVLGLKTEAEAVIGDVAKAAEHLS